PRAAERLVRTALAGVPTELVSRVCDVAAGNPFFLEELVRAIAAGTPEAIPETLVAVVQSRLEVLEDPPRRILRAASVLGRTFWLDGVRELLGSGMSAAEIEAWTASLVDRELVARTPPAEGSAEAGYAFRHAVLREAAYAMLTEDDRTLG